jgi:UDP-3-O-[3-hydroxymyristoyl] glucosamine N-acyltransferase
MISVLDILSVLGDVTYKGNDQIKIIKLVQIDELKNGNELAWCSETNIEKLLTLNYGTVICSVNTFDSYFKPEMNYILCEDPRRAFKIVLELFFIDEKIKYSISSSCKISSSAQISKNVYIGENCIIEDKVVIGDDCFISHNTIIHKGTVIGNNVKIGSNNTIGGVGFGYVKEKDDSYSFIHHVGNVEIQDNVEIGNNNCIDRAVLGSTLICKNVKIDNLVHIAHGVTVGENSLLIANSMIGGSAKIGKNCWIAPSVSILNKNVIGDNVTIGMGAVVIRDVPDGDVVVGNPAKSIRNFSK